MTAPVWPGGTLRVTVCWPEIFDCAAPWLLLQAHIEHACAEYGFLPHGTLTARRLFDPITGQPSDRARVELALTPTETA